MVLTFCNKKVAFFKGGFVSLFKEVFSCRRILPPRDTFSQ